MLNNNSDRKKLLIKILAIIAILVICYLLGINLGEQPSLDNSFESASQSHEYVTPVEGKLFLTMIDVEQGDGFLLQQDGKVALVDCGTRSTGENVVKYLKSQNIQKIDYVFGTHPHDDHMGGMYDVITNFEIGKVIIPKVENGKVTSNWYLKLMQELSSKKYDVEYVKLGTTYNLGEAKIKVIGPISEPTNNLNNYSTVLLVSFGEMDILMTGDAETSVEKEILESGVALSAEILKVGHHGSDTSSSKAFLDAVSPKYALISCEVGNKYNHPYLSTMKNLQERKVEVYRTDENGTVVLTITNNDVSFSCNPGDYLSGNEIAERSAKNND